MNGLLKRMQSNPNTTGMTELSIKSFFGTISQIKKLRMEFDYVQISEIIVIDK